jgi:hypothetical protein
MASFEPIRCADASRELSAPTGRFEPAALDAHRKDCPRCASEADQARRFDALWSATRPVPPASGFPTIWSEVIRAAEASPVVPQPVLPLTARPRSWPRWALAAAVLAQAAVILLVLYPGTPPKPSDTDAVPSPDLLAHAHSPNQPAPAEAAIVDIEPAELLIIRLDGIGDPSARLDRVEVDEFWVSETETVSFDPDLLGYFESRGAL